jgi:phosphonatase-like hydrolase
VISTTPLTSVPALAVFDMAGTTIDDRDEVYRVLREATERAGAVYSDEEFQRWMGTEKHWAIENLLRIGGVGTEEETVEEAWTWFRAELADTYTQHPPVPLPGVEDALRTLHDRGIRTALTTGFSREITDLILGTLGWVDNGLIDATAAGDEVPAGRPEPHLIRAVMAKVGVSDPDAVVSVGDTASDVRSAQAAGVTSVGVLTGHLTDADFTDEGVDLVLDSVADLPGLIPTAGTGAHA